MRWIQIAAAIIAAAIIATTQATAGEITLRDLDLYPQIDYSKTIQLAHNDAGEHSAAVGAMAASTEEPFEEPFMDGDKLHGYLGAASLLTALLTAATAPDSENPALRGQPIKKGFHHYAGLTAAALGGAAVLSGFIQHTEDLEPSLLDPDTAHMLLGVLATSAYAYAVSKGPKKYGMGSGGHAAAGIAGASMMGMAIYLEF
ncbi:MAG: hypothetical protein CO186_09495 [Zetaproteobacteria bacterium CG_4_9_14_3_um_filter_49_83]|nr:MAG: hypothetical protein AUJ56_12965 [Zetaproteobacteria bacterium CG1_02_49_23]PIV30840.1 MAG: hypothetical protein COS35_04510 [Zetaproteobacteria bacterium CG02_land_8_20_14_3_00_50_9]PIY56232.1 MAG: hypothetical protein COZ00_05345 [Zetaproteobacteria bacterium CG_4_10_14_0_8_um_filter_49_80]PJA34715.1 MAG: hypothetical protein CO186_09495 [Zetaproteobacteria bacterium CG_4_9_14_3_um_filter_49_83]